MAAPAPLAVLLAAGPAAPGARAVVARARQLAAGGRPVRVLLSAGGLAWAAAEADGGLAGLEDVAVCSRNAREAGWTAATTPTGVRWSSAATWLAEREAEGRTALWAVLP